MSDFDHPIIECLVKCVFLAESGGTLLVHSGSPHVEPHGALVGIATPMSTKREGLIHPGFVYIYSCKIFQISEQLRSYVPPVVHVSSVSLVPLKHSSRSVNFP